MEYTEHIEVLPAVITKWNTISNRLTCEESWCAV